MSMVGTPQLTGSHSPRCGAIQATMRGQQHQRPKPESSGDFELMYGRDAPGSRGVPPFFAARAL